MTGPPPDQSIVTFEGGIPGFPELERFVLVAEVEDGAFRRLQSLDDAAMATYVCVPWLFFPDYAPDIGVVECEVLGLRDPKDAVVFCPVTIDEEGQQVFVDLLGPLVINAENRRGIQLVLSESAYPAQARVDTSAA